MNLWHLPWKVQIENRVGDILAVTDNQPNIKPAVLTWTIWLTTPIWKRLTSYPELSASESGESCLNFKQTISCIRPVYYRVKEIEKSTNGLIRGNLSSNNESEESLPSTIEITSALFNCFCSIYFAKERFQDRRHQHTMHFSPFSYKQTLKFSTWLMGQGTQTEV